MNVKVFRIQIVFAECPCAEVCRLRPASGSLTDRLRKEMRHGRDANRTPPDLPGVTLGMATAFHNCPERN